MEQKKLKMHVCLSVFDGFDSMSFLGFAVSDSKPPFLRPFLSGQKATKILRVLTLRDKVVSRLKSTFF